ncbi:transient receptor potential channel [Holotrichia oblita]|uniref:Transient receptor potential channel n=1 Tax=Holotrichia oblita TaxID=644536 RepID=A0ACB9T6T0_HOLOL|nr:transient receptor potential channel [Holotrichia oblita]
MADIEGLINKVNELKLDCDPESIMLILASQRIETLFFAEDPTARIPTKRGAKPSLVEWIILAWVSGLNQLLWYYAEAERQNCPTESPTTNSTDTNACQIWRRFANLFETAQTLFWAVFGLIDLESFDLSGIKIFTRFWGMLMFGTYSVINIVVLLNLLIAMMNHSYQLISERADIEWKFARSKLWISYFEEGGTVPPPFNIVPTPKSLWYVIQWVQRKLCGHSRAAKKEHMRTIRALPQRVPKSSTKQQLAPGSGARIETLATDAFNTTFSNIVSGLVRINETKNVERTTKINVPAGKGIRPDDLPQETIPKPQTQGHSKGTGGKKNRQKERRLMKGFNIGPQPSTTTGPLPPVAEFIASLQQHHDSHHHDLFGSTFSGIFNSTPRKILQHSTVSSSQCSINEAHHRTLGRLHMKRTASHKRRWGTLIEAAKAGKVSRLIGRSRSEDSVCNSHCRENNHNHSHSHSNSPASEDNVTDSPSDSNPSIDQVCHQSSHSEPHGLAAGLSLLKKKRKKFSASRNTSPVVVPSNPVEHAIAVCIGKSNKKVLKRASSVPTRVPEVVQLMQKHEQTQSQQDSVEISQTTAPTTLTPSTTEESVTNAGHSQMVSGISSREPLLYNSSSSNQATGSSQTPEEEYRNNGQGLTTKLPGVIPLSGHNCPSGWL